MIFCYIVLASCLRVCFWLLPILLFVKSLLCIFLFDSYQNNIQEVAQRIALCSPSQDIFRAMVENAAERTGTAEGEFIDGLSSNQELVDVSIMLF